MGNQESSPGGSLYEKRKKLYILWVKGRFQALRNVSLTVLILFFYLLPWLEWQGRPAVWFNLPERKFFMFGITFWPQDFILLSWFLILSVFVLFFFTVVAGRLWCGYACPQTVWTKYFIWIEHLVEGDRNKRIALDRSPWNWRKLRIKGIKHASWILLAFFIAFTAVGFFIPIRELYQGLVSLSLGSSPTFWLVAVTGFSYVTGTFLREQVCIYMCPYARFQSVMFDTNTLIISYDEKRGEPRGHRKRKLTAEEQGKGSCIDCKLCVHACPTGIDIRDGLQVECIGCAACVDVCDDVMDKMGYEPGLIRYCTENELNGVETRRVTPRVVAYGLVMVLMVSLFSYRLVSRVPLSLDIVRDRARLYREVYDGGIENTYTLKILNMDQVGHRVALSAEGVLAVQYAGKQEVFVEAGEALSLPIHLVVSPENLKSAEGNTDVTFTAQSMDEPKVRATHESRFIRPVN